MSRVTSFFNWIFRHEEKLPLVFILFLLIPIFFEEVKPYRFPMLWILLIVAMLRGYLVELSYPDRTAVFRNGKSWARGDKLFLLIFYLTVAGVVVLLLNYGIAGSLPLLIPLLLMAAYMGIVGTFRNVKRQVLKEQIESQHWVDCLIFTPTVLVICEQAILEIAKARLAWRWVDADRIEIWEHDAPTPGKIVDLRCFAEEKRANLLRQLRDGEGEYPLS